MYKHLQLRFLQNVEDATGIVFSNEAMQGHVWYRNNIQNFQNEIIKKYNSVAD